MRKLNLRCIFGHKSKDLEPEKVGDFAFMYEQCERCEMYRTTIVGMGGISTKKWESKESFEKFQRESKERQERHDKLMEQIRKNGEERDRKLKELYGDIPSTINVTNKQFGEIAGRDLTIEAERRNKIARDRLGL